jgi:adenylate cyclase
MFNQIMTGEVWRTLPRWVTLLATVAVGVLATLAVSFLPPWKALVAAAGLIAGYLALNGYLLFDYGNLILGAAGPVVAVGAVYSGGTLAKLAVERWERARITKRFSSYVDPKLVEFVLEHPEQAHFEGQVREMSVAFCDVAGFTRLTETRGSETVTILNELWGVVVPAIQQHGGLINKFMGDGIMFFFGAPEQSPHHARDAVTTILAVRKAVDRFNAEIAPPRKWPALELRCGVSTGNMVVGDAGYTTSDSETRADYTVLGDNVNLGSRLEAANKAVGTRALVTDRTYELSKDAGILFRPVGKLCVVGKQTGVMTYEPMALLDDATEQQKSLAAATRAVVESFLDGRLEECLAAIDRMESQHGPGKLTAVYRERCEWFMADPSRAPFDCQIVLTEK